MKKATLVFLVFFFFFGSNPELINAQGSIKNHDEADSLRKYIDALEKARVSISGLEVSNYKKVHFLAVLSIEERDNYKLGLTNERIRTKCELRLRQAGLDPERATGPSDFLFVSVEVLGSAVNIRMEFLRLVLFEAGGTLYFKPTQTWKKGGLGIHGGSQEYIMQGIDEYLDSFLNEYLKANAK